MKKNMVNLKTWLALILVVLLASFILTRSNLMPSDQTERVRAFTRDIEFDYVGWTIQALQLKLFENALGTSNYLSADTRHQIVLEYMALIADIQKTSWLIDKTYADPAITDPETASEPLRAQLKELQSRRDLLAPVTESILQNQIAYVANAHNLTPGGQALPPVLYQSTPLPLALIVSPRNVIRQDEDISLMAELPTDQQERLEETVDRALDVSSLVVHIGGVGMYPTMVQETSSLEWLSEVVAHEWVHNFLTIRPLGMNYLTSPELRTINETTASIAGKELGREVLEHFYPELLPPPSPPPSSQPTPAEPAEPPPFNFREQMRETRVTVDQLLAEGKIDEAEQYMEARRVMFWDNGYLIRKLNQAYFAFHGAYADQPGGAAGEDPVGAAVRALRAQSGSLEEFLYRIAWITSFEDLQQAVTATQ